jgi:hypothetical protein
LKPLWRSFEKTFETYFKTLLKPFLTLRDENAVLVSPQKPQQ